MDFRYGGRSNKVIFRVKDSTLYKNLSFSASESTKDSTVRESIAATYSLVKDSPSPFLRDVKTAYFNDYSYN